MSEQRLMDIENGIAKAVYRNREHGLARLDDLALFGIAIDHDPIHAWTQLCVAMLLARHPERGLSGDHRALGRTERFLRLVEIRASRKAPAQQFLLTLKIRLSLPQLCLRRAERRRCAR